MVTDCDVLIAGGGPVGSALALLLKRSGLRIQRVDAGEAQGDRPIALSHGSRLILGQLGRFDALENTPIRTIHVSHRGGFGRTEMKHDDYGVPALGYVISQEKLSLALEAALVDRPIKGRVIAWHREEDTMLVDLESGERLRTKLLVIADGGGATRGKDHVREHDYGQAAIVTRLWTNGSQATSPRPFTAFERFTPEGPIALLPDRDGYALVWCLPADKARAVEALDEPSFLAALQAAFGNRAGRFTRCAPRHSFPLPLRQRMDKGEAGVIAIGNASQTLHPVAGQGLNLGLRDAAELAAAIIHAPGNIHSLDFSRRYLSRRRRDRGAVVGFTDALVRGYSNGNALLSLGRGMALFTLDMMPPARRALARAMMYGLRSQPKANRMPDSPATPVIKH
jgi:2-octaprenyl-6-methoxyphenol hydroxylase